MPLVGFLMDTTLAAAHLVFAGVANIPPHQMGARPPRRRDSVSGRAARSRVLRVLGECRQHITRPPSEHLRRFYLDTVNFDANALKLAIAFAGSDG